MPWRPGRPTRANEPPRVALFRAALQLSCVGSRVGGHAQNWAFGRAPGMDCKDALGQPIAHAETPPLSTVGVRWAGAEGAPPKRFHGEPRICLIRIGFALPSGLRVRTRA
eukprot:4408643-Alexandrium_andersonii.AAC.3